MHRLPTVVSGRQCHDGNKTCERCCDCHRVELSIEMMSDNFRRGFQISSDSMHHYYQKEDTPLLHSSTSPGEPRGPPTC